MFNLRKSKLVVAAMLGIATLASPEPVVAQSFPDKPITFVVPWGAGGRTDIVGRMVSNVMGSILEQPIAVVNRTGGRGAVGTKSVLDGEADGYTVLVTTPGNQILAPLFNDVGFVPSDFRGIGRVASGSVIFASNMDQPFTDGASLIEYARANPGAVTYSAVKNNLPWLAAESLAEKAGIKFRHVPAGGDSEAVPMALGGHVNLVASSSYNAIASQIEGGEMRALIVFANERMEALPDTPTAIELGYAVTASPWTGIAVSKGVPEDRIEILRNALAEAMETKSILNFANSSGTTLSYLDGPGFEAQWDAEFTDFQSVVKK